MSLIEVNKLTKDYGHGRDVFDVTMNVEKGVCFGFLGRNGAGKTTAIRHRQRRLQDKRLIAVMKNLGAQIEHRGFIIQFYASAIMRRMTFAQRSSS